MFFIRRIMIVMKTWNARNLFWMILSLIISILMACGLKVSAQVEDADAYPEVLLPLGNLRGINIVTRQERIIHGFLGIPFAQPPVGNLRFKAPLAADAWTGTLNATQDAPNCLQFNKKVIGEEDCLYLNVYTPQLPSSDSKPLPVIVWILAGAFKIGSVDSADASPKYILDKDVLLVTFNHRLGPLGFLSTGDNVSPGNYGLKDQVLALKWVQANIQYFGGDASQVTLLGRSSGACSVNLLAMSDTTIGLFHKYIQMSGSALSPRAYVPRDSLARYSYLLGEHLGCPNATSTALVNCLRELNATQIVDTASLFLKWAKYPDLIWRPTDEPVAEGAVLTDSPTNLYRAGKIRDLPLIGGITRDEGLFYSASFYENPDLFDDFLNQIDVVLPYILLYHDTENISAHTAAIKAFYLNDLTAERKVLLANVTQLISDAFYIYPVYSAQKKRFLLGNSPQYLYSFDYLRTHKYSNDTVVLKGIQHGDEKLFLFPLNPSSCELGSSYCQLSDTDLRMLDIMIDLWTAFAINGTPTLASDNAITWGQLTTEDNYLRIGNGPDLACEMKDHFLKERMQFWTDLTDHSS